MKLQDFGEKLLSENEELYKAIILRMLLELLYNSISEDPDLSHTEAGKRIMKVIKEEAQKLDKKEFKVKNK